MRISDWSSDVCSSDLARGACGIQASVGWVERSETHRPAGIPCNRWVSLRSTHPTSHGLRGMTASLDRSACEMVEAAPRRLPWIAIAVERDDRIAGHDAADAFHPNTSVGGGNTIATFARGRDRKRVVAGKRLSG